MKNYLTFFGFVLLLTACQTKATSDASEPEAGSEAAISYTGTASLTQGFISAENEHFFICEGGRKTIVGEIVSTDEKRWVVPAQTNFENDQFPFASDLHNLCNGNTYDDANEAISKLDNTDIVEIDKDGELFTAFIFADNYFEMYVNGHAVGKDKVPFTKFNSSLVRFKAQRPFTVAMKLVDWEESLGIGTEKNRGSNYHAGDGGMVAVIKDAEGSIVAVTDENWKAQTFYTAPVKDLSCVTESGLIRASENCDEADSDDGTAFFGLHWELPKDWHQATFEDANWPNATTYSNSTIGVDNKAAYTNFADIFDDSSNDAKFIWSTNVVLDNEVIVRYTVE